MGVGLKGFTLLEISYEVANKVGGIYTVLVSKMSQAMEFAGNYYTIGPYHENAAASEFIREAAPKALKDAFLELENRHGISCHYGRWNIEKKPYAILVEPGKMNAKTNEIKHHLWEEYGIDSLGADDWFNEPAVWAECVGLLIEQMTRFGFLKGNIIAHFHEWLSGAGLLHLKSARSKIRTVFTTHSTVLGRTIAETGREDLYGMIKNGLEKGQTAQKEKVYQYQVQAKHMMEKASALNADVFTTVSETMAEECLFILGRKPLVLNNGLDMKKFPQAEEAFCLHEKCTKLIKNFLLGYFLPYYDVDFDNSLVVFISGRHEFRNKGIDIFIGALGKLNEGLRKSGAKKPIAAFIWVPASTGGRKPTVVEHLRTFNKARQAIESETERVEKDILKLFIRGETSRIPAVIDADVLQRLKEIGETAMGIEKETPPLTPFQLGDNNILRALAENGLLNRKEDVVKVIYYPAYVSEKDGLLGMKYYNAMAGCDVGIFPSYYESWGYTPLEAAALGLQSVTTDLSGFGRFIKPKLKDGETSITVLRRTGRSDSDAVMELHNTLLDIYKMSEEERRAGRKRAKELSMFADWNMLFADYIKAYGIALKKRR